MPECEHTGRCFTIKANATRFCDEMHTGQMYPGVSRSTALPVHVLGSAACGGARAAGCVARAGAGLLAPAAAALPWHNTSFAPLLAKWIAALLLSLPAV